MIKSEYRSNINPCSICENYSTEYECDCAENCPVEHMKRQNEKLIKKVKRLQNKVDDLEAAASWEIDIRRGQVQGMW